MADTFDPEQAASKGSTSGNAAAEETKSEQMATDEREKTGPSSKRKEEFYLRYYVGHKGKFGHEFLEFEFRDDGRLRYANNSQYKAENLIRKEVFVNALVIEELKRIISDSEIFQ